MNPPINPVIGKGDKLPGEKVIDREWMLDFVKHQWKAWGRRSNYKLEDRMALFDEAINDLKQQPTLLELNAPIFVFGDLHGQLGDLRRLLFVCGPPRDRRFLFLGDYVDRGHHMVDVVSMLFCYRLLYPTKVFLLRGNHELAHVNLRYGLWEWVEKNIPNLEYGKAFYDKLNEAFSYMPLAAVISNQILCMHGGISPKLNSLNDIRIITRPIIKPTGLAHDLLWADPKPGCNGFQFNDFRASSVSFGESDTMEKLKLLGLSLIIRAHQVFPRGFKLFADSKVVTIFSASRYSNDQWNYAAVAHVHFDLKVTFIQVKPHDFDEMMQPNKDDSQTLDCDPPPSNQGSGLETKGVQEREKSLRGRSERGKTIEEKDE